MDYPQDRSKMTYEQIEASMRYYLSLKLNTLRKKQGVVSDQLNKVAKGELINDPVGVMNLRIQMALMKVAVDRLAFPEDQPGDFMPQVLDMLWYDTRGKMGEPMYPGTTTVVDDDGSTTIIVE